ncbi:putative RNA-directed DNA polymerase [Dioscorea sansibarensis]
MKGKSFPLDPMMEEHTAYSTAVNTTETWHKRLVHFPHEAVLSMQRKELVRGLPQLEADIKYCKACQFGKQARLSFSQSNWRATEKLQLIHTDLVVTQRTP